MTTMPVTTSFPEFVPNQILTNTQLNELREYLDDQNRLTRVRLTGTGIICGLHANIDDSGNSLVVHITNGYGVTSDGYIIEIPDTSLVAKADYLDSYREEYALKNDPNNEDEIGLDVYGPNYEPWRLEKDEININVSLGLEGDPPGNPVTQIAITELLTQDQADENNDSTNILLADFIDHVLVLYLEIEKHDLKSCLTTDCNNKGQNLEFVVKALLIHQDELSPVEPCKDWTNPAFIPRFHRALSQNGVGTLDQVSSTNDINGAYSKIVNDVKIPLFNKIQLSYNQVNPFLQLNIDMADVLNTWNNALTLNTYNQYHYDFVKDVACAYNEFIGHYCKIIDNCCSLEDFPRHLMIRDFVGEPEPYRHEFQPSPVRNVMHHYLKKAEILFLRIVEMIQQFDLQQINEIKITPSQTDRHSLGEKAIPHYYKLQTGIPFTATKIKSVWQGEACCKDPSLLSYAENMMVTNATPDNDITNAGYIESPLEALIDKKGFFRIEGHLDQDCKTAIDSINNLRHTHNLDFNIQLLRLDDSKINISESQQIKKIKDLLKEAEFVRNDIEQHYFGSDIDPDFIKERNAKLDDIWKTIEEVNENWLDIRCNIPLNCDLTQARADYLIIRSRVICTYNKIKKVLGELPDLKIRDNGTNPSFGEVSNQLNKVRARKTELAANLNSEGLTKKKRSQIGLEMAKIKSEHSRLVQIENIFKIGARISDNMKARNTDSTLSSESATGAVAFNLNKSNIFTEGLRIGLINLKSDVEKMCAQLPKDGLKFNYCLFIYHYKNVIAGLIQLKLLAGVFIEYLAVGINQNPASSQVLPYYAMQLAAGYLSEITDYFNAINRIQYNCFHAELATSYYTIEHLVSHRALTFGAFAKKHTGMEHLAGVTRGDTFILVCDEVDGSKQIVADFTLSSAVGCCCDVDPENLCLPPIALPDYKVIRFDERADQSRDINEIIDVISNDINLNGNENLILSLLSKRSTLNQLSNESDNLSIEDQNGKQQIRYTQIYRSFALDSFRYQIHQESDCKLMDEGEVIIFIRPEFGRPLIVQSDIVATSEGQAIDIDVVTNDLHLGFLPNEVYTLAIPRQAAGLNGNISVITPSGQARQFIKYVPSAGFVGRDNFEYEVRVSGKTSRGAVTVLVVPCCKDDGGVDPDIINTGPTIIGTVTDFTGLALIGMNVVVNNNLGTTTDIDGRFTLRNIPLGRHRLVFSFTGFKSQTYILNVSAGIPSATLNIILQESTITNPPSSVDPVGPVDIGILIDLVLPGEFTTVDHSKVVLDTFTKRHAERVNGIEDLRNDSVVGTTDAFAKADSFINNTMIDSTKSIKAITAEYKRLTKSLIDAHKLSSGESKRKYKGLIENTTHAYMDKMIIKDPNKAESTMQAELEKSITSIKKEGISVVGFKKRFKGSELKAKMKISALGDINKTLK